MAVITTEMYHARAESLGLKWLGSKAPKREVLITQWECPICGKQWEQSYKQLGHFDQCPHCFIGTLPQREQDYHNAALRRNWLWIAEELPSGRYKDTLWLCDKNHKTSKSYDQVFRGWNCNTCAENLIVKDYRALAKKHNLKWRKDHLPKTKVEGSFWTCERGHTFEATYDKIYKDGISCPECAKVTSARLLAPIYAKLFEHFSGELRASEQSGRVEFFVFGKPEIVVIYDFWYWNTIPDKKEAMNLELLTERDLLLLENKYKLLKIKSNGLFPYKGVIKDMVRRFEDRNVVVLHLKDWAQGDRRIDKE